MIGQIFIDVVMVINNNDFIAETAYTYCYIKESRSLYCVVNVTILYVKRDKPVVVVDCVENASLHEVSYTYS